MLRASAPPQSTHRQGAATPQRLPSLADVQVSIKTALDKLQDAVQDKGTSQHKVDMYLAEWSRYCAGINQSGFHGGEDSAGSLADFSYSLQEAQEEATNAAKINRTATRQNAHAEMMQAARDRLMAAGLMFPHGDTENQPVAEQDKQQVDVRMGTEDQPVHTGGSEKTDVVTRHLTVFKECLEKGEITIGGFQKVCEMVGGELKTWQQQNASSKVAMRNIPKRQEASARVLELITAAIANPGSCQVIKLS